MAPLDSLIDEIGSRTSLDRKIEVLVNGLADRIKATSNDQNIQRLAAELRRTAPELVRVLGAKADA